MLINGLFACLLKNLGIIQGDSGCNLMVLEGKANIMKQPVGRRGVALTLFT